MPRSALRSAMGRARREWSSVSLLRQQGHELVCQVRRGDTGDLRMVVRGRDFDDIRADQVEPLETAYQTEEFAARQPADLGSARRGGMGGVEHVDVDRDVQRMP